MNSKQKHLHTWHTLRNSATTSAVFFPHPSQFVLYAPCVTYACRSRLYPPVRHSRGGLATVIGTLLILWLGIGLAVWLLWAVSRVPTLLIGLAARFSHR